MKNIAIVCIVTFLAGCTAPQYPYEDAIQHPREPTTEEIAWFREHPEARERLLGVLADPELPDSDPSRVLAWSLLKQEVLTEAEASCLLNQDFNLVANLSGEKSWWWAFDRRTAPEFVYIRPQMWVFLNNGWVKYAKAANTPGNGVEVHASSSGPGLFGGPVPVDKAGVSQVDEFRLYYKVVSAPTLPWLEGHEDFLKVTSPKIETTEQTEQ